MRLTGPKSPRQESWKYGIGWSAAAAGQDTDRGVDETTSKYPLANPRGHISLRVFLRLTAMDVCCGPPLPFRRRMEGLKREGRIPWEKTVLPICHAPSGT
jgi:hypothetical protein